MKNIFKMILSAFVVLMSGYNAYHFDAQTGKASTSGKFFRALADDEPVVMHSHVRNTGGLAISGATVSLTQVGTTSPQYSGTTDSYGDFTFDSVAQGNYHYKITAADYYTKNVSLGLFANTTRTDTLIAK